MTRVWRMFIETRGKMTSKVLTAAKRTLGTGSARSFVMVVRMAVVMVSAEQEGVF